MKHQNVILVYNPCSNGLLPHRAAGSVEPFLHSLLEPLKAEFGLNYELLCLEGDTLKQLDERLDSDPPDAIWVAGGDGSVLALADLTRKRGIPLGVVPAGTMNLLARDLGMSLELGTAFRQLASADAIPIDMAEVNGHPFLCISNLGLSTRFTQLREARRHQNAWLRWPSIAWHMITALFNYPNMRIEIRAQGRTWGVKSRAIAITNNPLCNNASLLPARAALDSGKLAIYVTAETSAWSLPRLYLRMMRGKWQHQPELLVIHTDEAVFKIPRRRRIRLMSDGELLTLKTPLRYRIRARSLNMLRPAV